MTALDTLDDFKGALLGAVPHLRAFARSLCRNQDRADDLVQETLLRAWEHRDGLREGSRLKPWLMTILRNVHYMAHRSSRREVEDVDDAIAGRVAVGATQAIVLDFKDSMEALDRLPAEQRAAIVLVFVHNLSYEEAAVVCGCAVGTLKSRINRARSRLTALLGLAPGRELEADPVSRAAMDPPPRQHVFATG